MLIILFGTLAAFISCYLLVRFNSLHAHLSNDHVDAGPQKFHAQPTPRIGGIGIALGLIAAYLYLGMSNQDVNITAQFGYLLLAAIPAFSGGLAEDLTRRVSVLKRLVLSMVSAGIGAYLLGAIVSHLGSAVLDWPLQWPVVAVFFTLFAVGGVVNAINIIDGFNGIVSGFSGFMLLSIAFVSFQLDDVLLFNSSLAMLGALLGFLFWNYPSGKIFLGDGGSYLIGFWLAEMAVLIVARHPSVSPWFAALLLVHPVCETLFSVYRRKFLHGSSPWHPDGLHLHTLIFRRLNHIKWASRSARHKAYCNSMTAPYFWVIEFVTALSAAIFWDNSVVLIISTFLFVAFYVWLYWRIVKFKTPIWLVKRDKRRYRSATGGSVHASGVEEKRDRRSVHGIAQIRLPNWLTRRNRRHHHVRTDNFFRYASSSGQSDRRSHLDR
jgi:UDP-GlcNAc:undecaprenyl-phosphate/decaprenyl-phosphate GlcNAc-1-phosphate transferase